MVILLAPIALLLLTAQSQTSSSPSAASPDELRALFAEAVRLHQARQLDAAADAYGRFLKEQPRNVEALSNLGAVLAAQGRYDDAVARYQATDFPGVEELIELMLTPPEPREVIDHAEQVVFSG